MSLDTYQNLKTEIADWLNKSNLSGNVDTFIDLAEADIASRLRIRALEAVVSGTLSSASLDMAAEGVNFKKIKSVYITSGSSKYIQNYLTQDVFDSIHNSSQTGIPRDYKIVNDVETGQTNLVFGPAPASSYPYTISYYQRLPALTSRATTNYILLNYPGIYLYGSLYHASLFLKQPDMAAGYQGLYEAALNAARTESINDRPSGTSRQVSEMGTP